MSGHSYTGKVDISTYDAPMLYTVDQPTTLNGSGEQQDGSFTIYWNDISGFSGQGWYYDDPGLPIKTAWEAICTQRGDDPNLWTCRIAHKKTEAEFVSHASHSDTSGLINLLKEYGGATDSQILRFFNTDLFINSGCFDLHM